MSVDISTDTRPICRSTYCPILNRCIDRDMSVDMLTDISAKCRSMYRPTVGQYLGRYSARHSADTVTIDCRWNIGRLLVEYQSTVGGISVDCRTIYYDYQLSATKFGQQFLTLKSCCYHRQLTPFPVATCRPLT